MTIKDAKYLRQILSNNLNHQLKLMHKTKTDVSHDLNISETTVRSWFNGDKYPRIDSLQLLADYFKVNRSDLTDEEHDKINSNEFNLKYAIDNDEPIKYGDHYLSAFEKKMLKRVLDQ